MVKNDDVFIRVLDVSTVILLMNLNLCSDTTCSLSSYYLKHTNINSKALCSPQMFKSIGKLLEMSIELLMINQQGKLLQMSVELLKEQLKVDVNKQF